MKPLLSPVPTTRELRMRPWMVGLFYFSLVFFALNVAGFFLGLLSISQPVISATSPLFLSGLLLARSKPVATIIFFCLDAAVLLTSFALMLTHH